MDSPKRNIDHAGIQKRLGAVLGEIKAQSHLAHHYGGERMSFDDEMDQIREFIEYANEYGLAYEGLVANLQQVPFVISGKAAIGLLEVGLLFGYKTEDPKDEKYDRRVE